MNKRTIETMNLLEKYLTARIDMKNFGSSENTIIINQINDLSAFIEYPRWFANNDGKGLVIQSNLGILDLDLRCVRDGKFQIKLKGIDCLDINHNRFPIYIDYINFEINSKKIIDSNKLTWHDEPFIYEVDVKDSDILKIHLEWLPFNNRSIYNNDVVRTKKKLVDLENKVKKIPQLSCSSFGYSTNDGKIRYYNWRSQIGNRNLFDDFNGYCEQEWFTFYLRHKFPNDDFKINFIGPFERHYSLTWPMDGKKVFYTGENLDKRYLEMKHKFDTYALDYVDFSMGFHLIDHEKYLRFPLWVWYHFPPEVTEEEIEKTVDSWNSLNYPKSKDVVNVSSHDHWNSRVVIANDVETVTNISYGGNWRKNTDELHTVFKNNKKAFIKQFRFNVCPENTMSDGYVTEKIFDSIRCDCIPLYAGGGNYLEPEVINPNAILKWDIRENADNSDSLELFKNLYSDEKTYREFKEQDVMLDSSKKYIINLFLNLKKHFERLIYD